MEPTYTVQGADGKQYGPVTAEQLRGWAREGRVTGESQILRSNAAAWVAAATLPELGLEVPAATPVPAPIHVAMPIHAPVSAQSPELQRRVRSGASWFYWIAAFSVINSIIMATGSGWGFALGLGVTSFIDALASGVAGAGKAVAIALNIGAAAFVAMFGFFAGKGHAWAFIIGMILLALDTAVTGLLQMWISLAIHAFALFCIFAGFKASRALRG